MLQDLKRRPIVVCELVPANQMSHFNPGDDLLKNLRAAAKFRRSDSTKSSV